MVSKLRLMPSHTPVRIIIRFTPSVPDLHLSISSPATTNAAVISRLIRPHLPPALSACPLRLIYAGSSLQALQPLSISLRLSPYIQQVQHQPQDFYIHCSIFSDIQLTAFELDREAQAGRVLPSPLSEIDSDPNAGDGQGAHCRQPQIGPEESTGDAPQSSPPLGFDRLLSAGLSSAEVATLRSQFLAIQSHTHTPDTMPTSQQLRVLEERWLDTGNTPGRQEDRDTDIGVAGSGEGWDGAGDMGEGGLEDMLWGNVIGFFWSVGAVVWLIREEGVWSQRRKVGIVTGVLVNIAFCMLRLGS